jgi:hypothetical protein
MSNWDSAEHSKNGLCLAMSWIQVSRTVCKSSRKYSAFCNTIQTGNFPLPGLVEHPPPPHPCCQLSVHSWQRSIFSWQSLVSNWLLAKNKAAADSFQIIAPCPSEIALVTQPASVLNQLSVSARASDSCRYSASCQFSTSCRPRSVVSLRQ